MSELSRCSTCGYRWVSAGWTCPRCGYAPRGTGYGDDEYAYDSGSGCTENCLLPLGCLAALFIVPMVLLLGLAALTMWQTWVIIGVGVAVAGGVALYRYRQNNP